MSNSCVTDPGTELLRPISPPFTPLMLWRARGLTSEVLLVRLSITHARTLLCHTQIEGRLHASSSDRRKGWSRRIKVALTTTPEVDWRKRFMVRLSTSILVSPERTSPPRMVLGWERMTQWVLVMRMSAVSSRWTKSKPMRSRCIPGPVGEWPSVKYRINSLAD